MTIAVPRLHIICGVCGSNKELSFEIVKGEKGEHVDVHILCRNCSSRTALDNIIREVK